MYASVTRMRSSRLYYHNHELELNKSELHKTWGTMKKIIDNDAISSKRKYSFKLKESL